MRKFILALCFVLLWVACAISFTSCGPEKKIAKAKAVLSTYKQEAAEYCAATFPPVIKTEIIKGETIRDTITNTKTEVVTVDCPPSEKGTKVETKVEVRYKTVNTHTTDTVVQSIENTAQIFALNGQLQAASDNLKEQDKEVKKWKQKAKTRSRNQFVLLGVILVMGAWLTRKLWMPVISMI